MIAYKHYFLVLGIWRSATERKQVSILVKRIRAIWLNYIENKRERKDVYYENYIKRWLSKRVFK